jgi:hypothetical protein
MKISNVDFNEHFWANKSLAEFIEGESHHELNKMQMEEAYYLINPKKNISVNTGKPDKKGS